MYALNADAAKAADSTGNRISEKGKYVGRFTRAQDIVSKSGTRGIDFDFEAGNGQKARFSIYTVKSDGSQTFGYKQLMAIMTVLKLRNIGSPTEVQARVYDFDAGQEVDKVVPQFAELLDKPIGLLFSMEEYKADKWRPNLQGVFQADTELVASEILDRKTQPLTLPKMVERLRDKPLTQQAANYGNYEQPSDPGFDDPSDIPF